MRGVPGAHDCHQAHACAQTATLPAAAYQALPLQWPHAREAGGQRHLPPQGGDASRPADIVHQQCAVVAAALCFHRTVPTSTFVNAPAVVQAMTRLHILLITLSCSAIVSHLYVELHAMQAIQAAPWSSGHALLEHVPCNMTSYRRLPRRA